MESQQLGDALNLLLSGVYLISIPTCIYTTVLVAQLCPTLRGPEDCSSPGSSVHWISQAGILEWVAISFSRDLPDPGIEPGSPALADEFFTTEPLGNKVDSDPLY